MRRILPRSARGKIVAEPAIPQNAGSRHRLKWLATDTLVYGVASAVSKSFALILFPFLTRNLSVADYGRLDLALYTALLFGLIIVWGQDSAVARLFFEDEARDRRRQIISQALLVMAGNLLLCGVAVLALLQTSLAEGAFGPRSVEIIWLLMLYAPISGLLSFCQSLLKWTFARTRYVIIALGLPATNLAIILLAARSHGLDPVIALAILTGVGALFCALGLFFIRQWLTIPRGLVFARQLLPLALPYGAIACITALSPLIERAVVSEGFGAVDLGLYAAAAKIASIAMMLSVAFQMGWGPFSYSIYKEPDAARTYSLVLRWFSVLMCLAVLALSAISGPLTTFLAGERYAPAALYVFPLAMAFAVQAIGWITEIGIHLSKRTYLNLVGFTLFITISLLGILYLSQIIGIIGVALGALAGQLAMALTSALLAQRAFRLDWHYGLPAVTVAITLASGAGALLADRTGLAAEPWWFYFAGMVGIAAVNLLFGLDREDRGRIARIVRGPRGA
jgi:O-antigen/teichoic acid export membrane protein